MTLLEQPNAAPESQDRTDDSFQFGNMVRDLYESSRSFVSGLPLASGDLVSQGKLPNVELFTNSENSTESIGRARDSSKLPQSDAIREAQGTLTNPESSQEDKLRAAEEMSKLGQSNFVGPDGRRYDISVAEVNGRTVVSVHTNDAQGNSHPVLRGIVEKDGTVTKQIDASGKPVAIEGDWASKNLKDSPLIGSKEKSEDKPSAEREHLLKTLKDQGIAPPEVSHEQRQKLAKEHGKLEGDLQQKVQQYEALKKTVDLQNKPIEAEIARLNKQIDELSEKDNELHREVGRRNQQLAEDLKKVGIGDGKTFDVDDKNTYKKLRDEIDAKKDLDPATKQKLKADVDGLEKANKDAEEHSKKSDRLSEKVEKLYEQKTRNEEPLRNLGKEIKDLRKDLRANEDKLQEGKFKEDLKEIDKLPKEKREAVYKALEQIANDKGGAPNNLSPEQRKQLVEQLAHQIAHPESISQGNKGTCGLASSEMELARNHPDKYAQYLADLATKGETTLPGGGKLKVSPDMINRDGKPHDDANPERTLASKIFQTASANRVLENEAKAKGDNPGQYVTERPGAKYPIELPDPMDPARAGKDFRPTEDTGERIVMPDGTVKHWDGVDHNDIAKLTSDLTGDQYEAKPIVNGRNLDDPAQMAAAEKDFIDAAKKNGVPMKVSLTMTKGDFTGMNAEGGHEVVVTKVVDGPPAMVYFENTAGGTDHGYPTGKPVPLSTFLKSMRETRMSDGRSHIEGYVITKK